MRSYNTYKLRTLIKHGAFLSLSLSLSLPQRRRSQGMTQGDTASDCGERGTERRLAVSLSLSLSLVARSLSLSLSLFSPLPTSRISLLAVGFSLLLPFYYLNKKPRRGAVRWFLGVSQRRALRWRSRPLYCHSAAQAAPGFLRNAWRL
jgi:hypothetical protein